MSLSGEKRLAMRKKAGGFPAFVFSSQASK
jgi:hypothetical protein